MQMIKTKNPLDATGNKLLDSSDMIKNGLEEELDSYTRSAVSKIRFNLVVKPALISLVALVVSFFLDISTVPVLGDVTFDLAKSMFPNWTPPIDAYQVFSFWWMPIVVYAIFVFIVYMAYSKLKIEIIRTPATETIDRLIEGAMSVVDSIATALPLIGAAILLISIKLGEEVFLGLSVPFEIKALIILALGKLFEPVLDQLGVEFQNVVNHVKDIRDKYFSRIQIESSKSLIRQFNQSGIGGSGSKLTEEDAIRYKKVLEDSSRMSELIHKNFSEVNAMMDKFNSMQHISTEKIQQLQTLATSMAQASASLSDDKTLQGLKSLESIVVKR
jgi:hypothetical protein